MNVRLAAVTTILVLLLGPIRFVIGEQFFPDVITTKSGEKIEGRITAESGESVTVSIETSTSRRDRVISKSDIDHILRGAPGERPTPKPTKLKQLNAVLFTTDAHRDNGKRFVVSADEKLTAFLELERVTQESSRFLNAE
jgi:hypothetical protein